MIQEILKIMEQFELEANPKNIKEELLKKEYETARPLRKYQIWTELRKMGVEVKDARCESRKEKRTIQSL